MNRDAGLRPCAGSVRWVEYPVLGPRVRGGLLREPGLGLSGLAFEGLSGGAPPATAGGSALQWSGAGPGLTLPGLGLPLGS